MEALGIKPFEKRIYLSSPTMHGEELKYITEAYETNWMSTIGENINEVERLCRDYIGCKYAVGLSSGTAALHMAIKLAGVKRGDKVFTSDTTFAATVNPIIYEGGIPVFIDCEKETWNMDPVALEKAFEIFPDVKVVVAANLYGTPLKYDEICAVCEKYGAVLIEDSAESLGASYKGKQTGSFGKYNVISFNGNKIITGSSGGVLVTNDEEAFSKVRKWSTQSRDVAPWYQHSELGYNYRMSNIIAGVIRGQMPYLSEHIAQKKAIYMRYKEAFKDLPVKMNPYIEEDMEPNFWLSCMVIDEASMCKVERNDHKATYIKETGKTCPTEILELLDKYNIEARPLWKPMYTQPVFKNSILVTKHSIADKNTAKSVGYDLFERGLCLPSDNKITPETQDVIIKLIKSCFN
ncbi:MAG: aminotransferase class I/II-fold pyridoxal phosphate-dependent enzyme [Bacteroidales bacterium]|nr:aminotransferase class I/II-fold pyridoxal phosphate-dependent enzyme [Bacteroidales bacterium]